MAGELLLFEEYFSVLQLKLCCNTYCFLAVQQLNSFFIFDLTNEWKNAFMHTMNIPSMVMWDSSIRTGVSSFESVIPTKTILLVVILFNVLFFQQFNLGNPNGSSAAAVYRNTPLQL